MSKKNKDMNIFTESKTQPSTIQTNPWADILTSIALTGTTVANIKMIVMEHNNDSISKIMDFNTSIPRVKRGLVGKFNLQISKPTEILDKQVVHCCLCGKVLNFDRELVWYHLIRYAVNCFATFICYDPASPSKPTTRCYRRRD